jgi:hypothetical protein
LDIQSANRCLGIMVRPSVTSQLRSDLNVWAVTNSRRREPKSSSGRSGRIGTEKRPRVCESWESKGRLSRSYPGTRAWGSTGIETSARMTSGGEGDPLDRICNGFAGRRPAGLWSHPVAAEGRLLCPVWAANGPLRGHGKGSRRNRVLVTK